MADDTARITLNRPNVHNALSMEMSDQLVDALLAIKKSTAVKFVVIKGAGNSFCAGDDITEMVHWQKDEFGKLSQGL
jgi:enoyl-CoA hydratase/carnithine racemase